MLRGLERKGSQSIKKIKGNLPPPVTRLPAALRGWSPRLHDCSGASSLVATPRRLAAAVAVSDGGHTDALVAASPLPAAW